MMSTHHRQETKACEEGRTLRAGTHHAIGRTLTTSSSDSNCQSCHKLRSFFSILSSSLLLSCHPSILHPCHSAPPLLLLLSLPLSFSFDHAPSFSPSPFSSLLFPLSSLRFTPEALLSPALSLSLSSHSLLYITVGCGVLKRMLPLDQSSPFAPSTLQERKHQEEKENVGSLDVPASSHAVQT